MEEYRRDEWQREEVPGGEIKKKDRDVKLDEKDTHEVDGITEWRG